jgi:hypothetical protein
LTGEDKGGGESRIDPPLQHLPAADRKGGERGFKERAMFLMALLFKPIQNPARLQWHEVKKVDHTG